VDATIEQVFSYFIFDADHYTKDQSLRAYITITDITRLLEGEYEWENNLRSREKKHRLSGE
jgi:hypothetical protein